MRYALAGLLLPLVMGARPVTPGPVDERRARRAHGDAPRQRAGSDRRARFKPDGTAVVLTNTKVLIVGGDEAVEVYDLERGRSRRIRTTAALSSATATVLPGRTVLFAGG